MESGSQLDRPNVEQKKSKLTDEGVKCRKKMDIHKHKERPNIDMSAIASLQKIKKQNNITITIKNDSDHFKPKIASKIKAVKEENSVILEKLTPLYPKIFVPDQLKYLKDISKDLSLKPIQVISN